MQQEITQYRLAILIAPPAELCTYISNIINMKNHAYQAYRCKIFWRFNMLFLTLAQQTLKHTKILH